MLRELLDLKRPTVTCESVHQTLKEVVQHVLVVGAPSVEIVEKSPPEEAAATSEAFQDVVWLLATAGWLPADVPISLARRKRRVTLPNPNSMALSSRIIRLASIHPAAAVLRTFLALRVLYARAEGKAEPTVRVIARSDDPVQVDTLWLLGDSFTERYSVAATMARRGEDLELLLVGDPPAVTAGLPWARDEFLRARDASLLLQPLRFALDGSSRPLVIPRTSARPLQVRVRVPTTAPRPTSIRWLSHLHDLLKPPHPEDVTNPSSPGPLGEHASWDRPDEGHIVATDGERTLAMIEVCALGNRNTATPIELERADGKLSITFEALGGAREIGANSYLYRFGRRAFLIDVGYDATRDGWLGLPALARIPRLDAIVLTHAHLDHVGSLPLLLHYFPGIPVYCTRATFDVMRPTLRDSATVAGYRLVDTGELPATTHGLVDGISEDRFRFIDYGGSYDVPEIPGLRLSVRDAGHVIGSATMVLEFAGRTICHTGDVSVMDQTLLRGLELADLSADHVVMEGTYSARPEVGRATRKADEERFLVALEQRIDSGGSVLIPAFSLGRSQELVALVARWNSRRPKHRRAAIYTVGQVNVINELSRRHERFLPAEGAADILREAQELSVDPRRRDDKDAIIPLFREATRRGPCVVIASHGMMMERTGSHTIGRAVLEGGDPRQGVFLCCYMDPRTPGFRLRHLGKGKRIDWGDGVELTPTIPAENICSFYLTAHASYEELVEIALKVPTKSVTLIHGEGYGLDRLKSDLEQRFRDARRDVEVRAPAVGERVLLDTVDRPYGWDVDYEATQSEVARRRASMRTSQRPASGLGPPRLSLTGDVVEDSPTSWALVGRGRREAEIRLDLGRLDPARVVGIEIAGPIGPASERRQVYSRSPADFTPRLSFAVARYGSYRIHVDVEDLAQQRERVSGEFSVGAALHLVDGVVDAATPVIAVDIGGFQQPTVDPIADVNDARPEFVASQHRLLISHAPFDRVGLLTEDLRLRLRWPTDGGFAQQGPGLGEVRVEPHLDLNPVPARVGETIRFPVSSTPPPVEARLGDRLATWRAGVLEAVPRRPGRVALRLAYRTFDGGKQWYDAGHVDVRSAARLELAPWTDVGSGLAVEVREVSPVFHGKEVRLALDGVVCEQWVASGASRRVVRRSSAGEFGLELRSGDSILAAVSVRIREGIELMPELSLPVTSADGALAAELCFEGPPGWSHEPVEACFASKGFVVDGWSGGILRLRGCPTTTGILAVDVPDGARTFVVEVLTLPASSIALHPSECLVPGRTIRIGTTGGPIETGWLAVNGGVLEIAVDRVAPLLDCLSHSVDGAQVTPSNPGEYAVAILCRGRRLAETTLTVGETPRPVHRDLIPSSVAVSELDVASLIARNDELPHGLLAVAVSDEGSAGFRLISGSAGALESGLFDLIASGLTDNRRVLVTYPEPCLPPLAGRVLARLRRERPDVLPAQLSFPAPRGEIEGDPARVRPWKGRRTLCYVPGNRSVDRGDAFVCPRCSTRMTLKTDSEAVWMLCGCGHEDRELVLTMVGLQRSAARVLFVESRMANYLARSSGRKYAGPYGRAVVCGSCAAPQPWSPAPRAWTAAAFTRLIASAAAEWVPGDVRWSVIRGARRAAGRSPSTAQGAARRFEVALEHLIEAGMLVDGRLVVAPEQRQRLAACLCLRCAGQLDWRNSRATRVFLGLEWARREARLAGLPWLASREDVRRYLTLGSQPHT